MGILNLIGKCLKNAKHSTVFDHILHYYHSFISNNILMYNSNVIVCTDGA